MCLGQWLWGWSGQAPSLTEGTVLGRTMWDGLPKCHTVNHPHPGVFVYLYIFVHFKVIHIAGGEQIGSPQNCRSLHQNRTQ